MICVHFVENALFKSSGDIQLLTMHAPLLSSLLDELSIDERDSDHFISRLVCRSSDSFCNSTESSRLTVDML
jgi:hypothetical protein